MAGTFAELGLSAKVLAAVEAAGYTSPTPIQAQAVPVAISGRDVLGIAQTGTGKTAAFVMPMITRLETGRARARMPRSLILAPTRELAAQVAQNFEKYGQGNKLSLALLIGGVSMDDQTAKLDRGVDVLIATPGRLLDHFQRGRVMLMGVEILVIDEADRMLDMGFIPDIEKICRLLPPKRQTLFFSATMPTEITRLADQFLKDPVRVEVARPATTAKTITQKFQFCASGEDWDKREMLRAIIRGEQVKNAIIFCNRKRDVAILLKSLQKHGFNAGALHGDMDQSSRMATLDAFRDGRITLLAASDVAARGLDIPDVSHVFNFDVPWASDDYVHRIGRTGRAGKLGASFTIVTPMEFKQLQDIEKMLGEPVTWIGAAPTPEDMADGLKRRRGRGGRFGRGRGEDRGERGERRGGRPERGDQPARGDRPSRPHRTVAQGGGEQPGPDPRERGDRVERAERPERGERSSEPSRREGRHTGARPPRRERQRLGEDPAGTGDQPRQDARPQRERQPDTRAAEPRERDSRPRERQARQGEPRPQRPPQQRGGERSPQQNVGFADNIPAFLRRPAKSGV
jgi:superfamily II DNA/RNA helicase